MGIDRPSQQIIKGIEGAIVWFNQAKLTGIRQIEKSDRSVEGGYDRVVIEDANAPPIWARFYQIGTNRPIFCGRDGIIKYKLAEIEQERRAHYAWYGYWPAELLAKDYPAWREKWTPERNVLKN
jgi:PelA/Pel-15E family pectate lyase